LEAANETAAALEHKNHMDIERPKKEFSVSLEAESFIVRCWNSAPDHCAVIREQEPPCISRRQK